MPYIFTTTTATYTLSVTQVNTTNHGTWTDVVSHVHWKLMAEDSNGNRVSSNGTLPFQLGDVIVTDRLTGETTTYPGVFDPESFVPYDQITEEMGLEWAQSHIGVSVVVDALAERLKNMPAVVRSQAVPWNTSTTIII
jgi:hypothetical protein